MPHTSAVEFEGSSRIHIGLAVRDLEQSLAFYRALLGQGPTKVRPHYAKFEVVQPPLNLALNEVGGNTGPSHPVAHFGIQVKSLEAVQDRAQGLSASGVAIQREENVTCCYAVQHKVWATDPDGNKWEVYVVVDNDGARHQSSQGVCCPEASVIMEGVGRGAPTAAGAALGQAGGAAAVAAQAGGSTCCGRGAT